MVKEEAIFTDCLLSIRNKRKKIKILLINQNLSDETSNCNLCYLCRVMPNVPFRAYRAFVCHKPLPYQTWVFFQILFCLIFCFVCNLLPPMPFALTSPMARRRLKALVRLLYLLLLHIPHSGFLKYHEPLISDGSAILTISELPLTTLMLQSP